MKGYIRQIDSLNTLNKRLISESVGYRKEISSAKLRAEMADAFGKLFEKLSAINEQKK